MAAPRSHQRAEARRWIRQCKVFFRVRSKLNWTNIMEPLAKYFVEVRSYATPPLGRGSKGSTRANMSGDGAVFEHLLFALRIF